MLRFFFVWLVLGYVALPASSLAVEGSSARRIERAFRAWTSVCLEHVQTGKRDCFAQQKITQNGSPTFAWEVRQTASGGVKITSEMAGLAPGSVVVIGVDRLPPILVSALVCNISCRGDVELPKQAAETFFMGAQARLQFIYNNGQGVVLSTPLSGLREALADAIQFGKNAGKRSDGNGDRTAAVTAFGREARAVFQR